MQKSLPLDRIAAKLEQLKGEGQFRTLRPYAADGAVVNLADNDYLGLAADEVLREKFLSDSHGRYRLSASASPLLMGASEGHERLDGVLRQGYGRKCLTFASGWQANTGLVSALGQEFGKALLIVADRLAHASMIDGMVTATAYGARFERFRHNDVSHLRRILEKKSAEFEAVLLLTESVFSMDGDIAPVADIIALKKDFANLLLAVDEAHGMGVYGKDGLGVVKSQNLLTGVDFLIGTFGKALASSGAFIAMSDTWYDFFVNRARPLIYSTAEPEIIAAWNAFLLASMPSFESRRQRLTEVGTEIKNRIRETGFVLPEAAHETSSHIVPLVVGSTESAAAAQAHFLKHGVRTALIRPPTVPAESARLRLSIKATLSDNEVDAILNALDSLSGALS